MNLILEGRIYERQATGGISRIFNELLPRWGAFAPDLQAFVWANPRRLRQPLPQHPRVRNLPPTRWWPFAPAIVDRRQPTVGMAAHYRLPPRWAGPAVVWVHDFIHERLPDLFTSAHDDAIRQRKRQAIEQATAVVCISETARRDLQEFCPGAACKTRVVPLAAGERFTLPTTPVKRPIAEPFLLHVGGRRGYKNFAQLLRVYARWPGRRDVAVVVVGGGDWTPAEESAIAEAGLGGRVRHLGTVTDEQLRDLYRTALALVWPSRYEGFGLPVVEALASGCPVIASRIPATEEVAGDCAVYFGAGDDDSLAAALEQAVGLAGDEARRQRGRARAGRFSWETTARESLAVCRELAR